MLYQSLVESLPLADNYDYFRNVCGSRIRVEPSTGRRKTKPWERDSRSGGYGRDYGGRGRGPPRYDSRRGPSKPFDPNDECYKCGERGHYAYDCGGSSRRLVEFSIIVNHILYLKQVFCLLSAVKVSLCTFGLDLVTKVMETTV